MISGMIDHELIWGRHPIEEALEYPGTIHRILVAVNVREQGLAHLLERAEKQHIPIDQAPRERLQQMAHGENHQGIIAYVKPYQYHDLDELLAVAIRRKEPPFLLALDTIQDVHNLGSLIRTAESLGVHGIIIPQHNAASVNATVVKTSAGAVQHMLVAQVMNLQRTLGTLKERDIWVVGLAGEVETAIDAVGLNRPLVMVVGGESQGLRRMVREQCDILVKLPMQGKINSMNAAVAGSIALYLARSARASISE